MDLFPTFVGVVYFYISKALQLLNVLQKHDKILFCTGWKNVSLSWVNWVKSFTPHKTETAVFQEFLLCDMNIKGLRISFICIVVDKYYYRLLVFPPDMYYLLIYFLVHHNMWACVCIWIILFLWFSGGPQSYWRSLEETCHLQTQWPPSLPACPSPGLETRTGTETGSPHPPAAACRTLQLRPVVSKARSARIRYVTVFNLLWK